MPLIHPDEFADVELARIFIAATMAEARLAEAILDERGIRYTVQAEALGRTLFGSPRHLAVFYVVAEEATVTESVLIAAGLEGGVVRD